MILRRVGLGSTAKVSLAFAVVMVLLVAAAAAVLYMVGAGLGIVNDVDRAARSVFNARHFHLTGPMFIGGAAGAAAVVGVVGAALTVIAATIYNRIAVLTGGIQARLPAAGSREAQPERSRPAAGRMANRPDRAPWDSHAGQQPHGGPAPAPAWQPPGTGAQAEGVARRT